ncbi:MAG: DUF3987 domain-containing protein [Proteobacteria bacterium]|nr:DUF3987 domain-containing protein [Pseudomonadota bacterium]
MELNLPLRDDIALPPIWLITAMPVKSKTRIKPASGTASNFLTDLAGFTMPPDGSVGEGQRNDFLARVAGWLQSQGAKGAALIEMLAVINAAKCSPPLEAREVEKVAASISRYDKSVPTPAAPTDGDDWPDPVDIKESLPPVIPFDPNWLPKGLRTWAQDIADRLCCPLDFPAVVMTTVLGSALGARIYCKPYANGSWKVPGNVWATLVAMPGTMKSPVIRECLRPLIAMDKRAADAYELAMGKYTFDKAVYDSNFKAAAKNSGTPPVAPQEPQMTRYLVNDSTYEMLVAIAAANPCGFMVLRDELAGWFHSLEKENQKEARGLYLTGWNGTDGYATDRIGRGHVRADHVVISLLGSVQPNVLRGLIQDAVSGGTGDDGLVQRFQLAVHPDMPPEWKKVDRRPDYAAEATYAKLIERFTTLDCAAIGASSEVDGTPYLPFSVEAQEVFDLWQEELESRIRAVGTDEHPVMLGHLGKFRSLFPKLALIMHLAAGGVGPISKSAAVRAYAPINLHLNRPST